MTSAVYPAGKRGLMTKSIDLVNDSITAVLIKDTYTYSNTHTSYTTDLAPHLVTGATVVLSSKAVMNNSGKATFDAADPTFTAVTSGFNVIGVAIYHTTSGTPIAWLDSGVGLPVTSSAADITVNFSNGTDRIFSL